MKAISVRQPWAWAILHKGKDVENRSWSTNYRGPLLIHAGLKLADNFPGESPEDLPCGCIVGMVDLVDVKETSNSPWYQSGSYAWILANPKAITPIPHKGSLGLFNVDASVLLPAKKDEEEPVK